MVALYADTGRVEISIGGSRGSSRAGGGRDYYHFCLQIAHDMRSKSNSGFDSSHRQRDTALNSLESFALRV